MIDSLFGSRTRVKLLHLFFNNPGKSFYVREITRLIDEQINSVRRELSNMLEVGVIKSASADNKLFYDVNQRYDYYAPLKEIFGDSFDKTGRSKAKVAHTQGEDRPWAEKLRAIQDVSIAIVSGKLVQSSASSIDILIAGPKTPKLMKLIQSIEEYEGHDMTYSVMEYEEFYYRLSVRDKFIMEPLSNRHEVIIDTNEILKGL